MSEHSAQERTEEATPKRRLQARRKGTVAKSSDLTGSLVLLALVLVMPAALSQMGVGFIHGFQSSFSELPRDVDPLSIGRVSWAILQPCLLGLAMVVGTAMTVGLVTNFAQVGFVLSAESMNPSFSKINPFNGFKRLFSARAGFEGVKAMAKCAVFALLAWSAIQAALPELLAMSGLPPAVAMSRVGRLIQTVAIHVGVAWLVLAAIDYYFQRRQVDKQLRMTKEELRQEMKEAETSPELRAAMAARRRKLSKGRMMDAVKTADVVVTNPTHYAVAIKYEGGKSHAPIVVAKGADLLAARIREEAATHRVPLVPNPPLARALYRQCEIGDAIPRELFQAVAEVLAHVYRTLQRVRK